MQVDTTRALARDEYRLTQVADKQKAWKGNVAKLKDAQDSVKTTRENFYRCCLRTACGVFPVLGWSCFQHRRNSGMNWQHSSIHGAAQRVCQVWAKAGPRVMLLSVVHQAVGMRQGTADEDSR